MIDTQELMSEPFDHTEFYRAEIAPLLEQVFNKCAEKDIPMVCAIAHANKPGEEGANGSFSMGHAAHIPGGKRTPISFRLADSAITEPLDETAKLAMTLAMLFKNQNCTREAEDAAAVH